MSTPEPPGVADGMTADERKDEFLRLLSQGCTVRDAAASVALHYSALYRQRQSDAAFAKRWEDAQRVSVGRLVQEAERRAMSGSDKLLMFLLTNYAPDKFKKQSTLEVTNPDGSLTMSPEDRAQRTLAILEKARQAKAAKDIGDLI